MPITIHGPAWPTVAAVRQVLAAVPEVGEYRLGGTPTDSIEQLTAFRGAGLLTPDFTTDRETARQWVRDQSLVFGRQLLHTRGNDIILPNLRPRRTQDGFVVDGETWNRRWWNSEWWSRYIAPTEEWRIHVFNGRTIARGRKILTRPAEVWRRAPVRNVGNGWSFDFTSDPPKGCRSVARKAVAALGYSVGAVDILQVTATPPGGPEPPTNEFYVLEVNRLPALTCPYTLGRWCEAIRRHVREGQ